MDSFEFFSKELLHQIKTCKKPKVSPSTQSHHYFYFYALYMHGLVQFWIFLSSFFQLFGLKGNESGDTVQPLLADNEKIENERTGSREKLTVKNVKNKFDSSQSEEVITSVYYNKIIHCGPIIVLYLLLLPCRVIV